MRQKKGGCPLLDALAVARCRLQPFLLSAQRAPMRARRAGLNVSQARRQPRRMSPRAVTGAGMTPSEHMRSKNSEQNSYREAFHGYGSKWVRPNYEAFIAGMSSRTLQRVITLIT